MKRTQRLLQDVTQTDDIEGLPVPGRRINGQEIVSYHLAPDYLRSVAGHICRELQTLDLPPGLFRYPQQPAIATADVQQSSRGRHVPLQEPASVVMVVVVPQMVRRAPGVPAASSG